MEGRTLALQQNWQSSEKSQNFKEKTQYLMNTLYKSFFLYAFSFVLPKYRMQAKSKKGWSVFKKIEAYFESIGVQILFYFCLFVRSLEFYEFS